MSSYRRIEQCTCCGVYFHATDGGVYVGNNANGDPEYMCARCGAGECDCEEEEDEKEERQYAAYLIRKAQEGTQP